MSDSSDSAQGTILASAQMVMDAFEGATFVTAGFAPGYRDANLIFHLRALDGQGSGPSHARIYIRSEDAQSIVRHLLHVHRVAWEGEGPIDAKPDERRPEWI